MSIPAEDLEKVKLAERVRMFHGGVEKMQSKPIWIECKEHHDYLEKLEERIRIAFQIESGRYSPFNLYRKIQTWVGGKMLARYMYPKIKYLKERYAVQLECPMGFLVGHINEEFQKFIAEHRMIIISANNLLSIKDDIYVRE